MGTSIHCFFAHSLERNPAALTELLERACGDMRADVEEVVRRGRFSGGHGPWRIHVDDPETGEPVHVRGEGPAGLGVVAYERVMLVTSAERFGALYDSSQGLAVPLRRLLCGLAKAIGCEDRIAVAAAGFGDTDPANDLAYYQGASMDEVCACLRRVIGPPCAAWGQLDGERGPWYLGRPEPMA